MLSRSVRWPSWLMAGSGWVLVLFPTVVPGCGAANRFSIQKAYGATLGSCTAKLQLTVTASGAPSGHADPVGFTGSGVADPAHQSFEMTMSLPAGEGQMQAVLSDDTLYMAPPPGLAGGSPSDRQGREVPLSPTA